jgi:hypothetical protein
MILAVGGVFGVFGAFGSEPMLTAPRDRREFDLEAPY